MIYLAALPAHQVLGGRGKLSRHRCGYTLHSLPAITRQANGLALRNREALTPLLDGILSKDSTENWLRKLAGLLPAAPVHDMAGALNNPFLLRTGMIRNTPHAQRSDFRTLANPIKLDGQRLQSRVCSPLGADTDDVLRAAGLTEHELTALHTAGAA